MTADQTRADATRARLLEAALTAFAERGFHATSTRDIAAAAGMSPAAVYVHHRSKEELLHQISLEGHRVTLDLVRTAIASSTDPVGQLAATARDFATHHARHRTSARVVNYELAALSDEHRAEVGELRRAIAGEIRGVVQRGVTAGAFDVTEPEITATALLSLGIDVARWYDPSGTWTPERIGDAYAAMALRIVGAQA